MATQLPDHLTLCYKRIGDVELLLDFYPPLVEEHSNTPTPAVVYFHGGGMTVGNRESWFPRWLQQRAVAAGYAFISADYRLIPPASGHEIVEDIRDLFGFLGLANIQQHTKDENGIPFAESHRLNIDTEKIAVAGSSAGGLCAYLAAMHTEQPKPKALLCMYAMGGNFITPHYLVEKKEIFMRGREILDPKDFTKYLFPFDSSNPLQSISGSPLAYHPESSPTPGFPANPRMLLARLYLQLGVFLDYWTGQHEPSLSAILREHLVGRDASGSATHYDDLIPDRHQCLFPQLGVSNLWPPTLLMHGADDSAVPVGESRYMHDLLLQAGVPVQLLVIEGKEHSFDYAPEAEEAHHREFALVEAFLKGHLE